MISDQERREVAARLRQFHRRDGETQLDFIAHMVYGKERMTAADYSNLPSRLAELIDRPTCRNVYDEVCDEYEGGCCENGFKCSKCGELVEDCEGYRVKGTFNYCPNCGAEVVPDGC